MQAVTPVTQASVAEKLKPGDTLYIKLRSGEKVSFTFAKVEKDRLKGTRDGKPVSVSLADISRLEIKGRRSWVAPTVAAAVVAGATAIYFMATWFDHEVINCGDDNSC